MTHLSSTAASTKSASTAMKRGTVNMCIWLDALKQPGGAVRCVAPAGGERTREHTLRSLPCSRLTHALAVFVLPNMVVIKPAGS